MTIDHHPPRHPTRTGGDAPATRLTLIEGESMGTYPLSAGLDPSPQGRLQALVRLNAELSAAVEYFDPTDREDLQMLRDYHDDFRQCVPAERQNDLIAFVATRAVAKLTKITDMATRRST